MNRLHPVAIVATVYLVGFGAALWQARMIEPERLAATTTEFEAERVRHGLPQGLPQDAEAWITLLAAVVTRSGYAWQLRLFGFTGGKWRHARRRRAPG